jgi:class 3 adenylate cyclase
MVHIHATQQPSYAKNSGSKGKETTVTTETHTKTSKNAHAAKSTSPQKISGMMCLVIGWSMGWGIWLLWCVKQATPQPSLPWHALLPAFIEGGIWSLMFIVGSVLLWQKPSQTWLLLWLSVLSLVLGLHQGFSVSPAAMTLPNAFARKELFCVLTPLLMTGMLLAQIRLLWFDARMRQVSILWQKTQQHLKSLQQQPKTYVSSMGNAQPQRLQKPVRHDLTAMFIDLRNFTTMGESLPAPEMIDLLNEFYAITAECVTSAGGWVNKYLGDGVLVLFGVDASGKAFHPETHARDALKASLLLMNRLNAMAARWQKERFLTISVGMSIHSGITLVGCFGQHTEEINVVGDTINLCSRLQDINKHFKTQLVVSAATKQRLEEGEPLKGCLLHLGEVEIRGRDSKVSVFTLASAMQIPSTFSGNAQASTTVHFPNPSPSSHASHSPTLNKPTRHAKYPFEPLSGTN